MNISEIYFISAVSIAMLFLISHFGHEQGWYKKKGNWFSSVMHFSGGFFVAMFWSGLVRDYSLVIVFTFLISLFWEMGEYLYGIYKFKKYGTKDGLIENRDTIEDLFYDMAGAVVLVLLF